ncbi:DUF6454 family protein [Bosea sp. NPDC055594]
MKTVLTGLTALAAAALSLPAASPPAHAADPALNTLIPKLTRGTQWTQKSAVALQFPTHHPQGMVKIGDAFFISSVEIKKPTTRYPTLQDGYDRDTGEGTGHLFKVDAQGKLLGSVTLGEGSVYHPGGIDFDGKDIWVPVAEYRPNSQSIVYRVDPETLKATEVFRFKDHVGGIVHNTDDKSLHGVSWGSRRFYKWPLDGEGRVTNAATAPEALRVANPALYIDYQDCHYIGMSRMLCSGLNAYRTTKDGPVFRLGGLEIVDLKDNRPVYQVPVELWSPTSGLPMTQNPFWVEPTAEGVRAYFMPDDDRSTLFTFEAAVK